MSTLLFISHTQPYAMHYSIIDFVGALEQQRYRFGSIHAQTGSTSHFCRIICTSDLKQRCIPFTDRRKYNAAQPMRRVLPDRYEVGEQSL